MRRLGLFVLIAVVAINVGVWTVLNRPIEERPWVGVIEGVSFSPYQRDHDPTRGTGPTLSQIDEDLRLLSGTVARVRTYSVIDGQDRVPKLAERYGMRVTVGAWIGADMARNEQEIRRVISAVRNSRSVDAVIVGNEALLRQEVTPEQLTGYLRRVRAAVNVPVSTAEPWHVWIKHPKLARETDFVAIHVLPYWEGVPLFRAVDFVLERYNDVRKAFPGKHVVITEVGWPSNGRIRQEAEPTPAAQATFLRQFLNVARQHEIDYFVMEAFDQPWKMEEEGSVGAYWGIFNADRDPKFAMTGPVVGVRSWQQLCAASIVLALIPILIFLMRAERLRVTGQLFYAGLIQGVASLLVWASYLGLAQYLTTVTGLTWGILSFSLLLVVLILLTEGFELTEMLWRGTFGRRFSHVAPTPENYAPRVSIHVPMYNEPPEMVRETLTALSRLDYPNFEVLVIDNNTRDPSVWRPVEALCADLGERFRFFHLDHCPGFKAGALNFALRHTDPQAEVVAVIDSDYTVSADWLRNLVPYFARPEVGIVQAPQDYRDAHESLFKRMIFWEYAGFFHIGMVQRNERNAIIQHGTMTMVRRQPLERIGGWGEWCITEDAELGLRFFEAGYEAVYVNHSYGRGLMPDTFTAYQKQRFRWAYGSVQILKRHWKALIVGGQGLTAGQRFHFLAGWFPWFADSINLIFAVLGVFWTVGVLVAPKTFDFPLSLFLMVTLSLFAAKSIKSLWLYTATVKTRFIDTVGAALAGLALQHTVAKAMLFGLFTSKLPFLRTPKCENQPALVRGITMVWQETVLMVALWASAITVYAVFGATEPEARLWSILMMVQSLPYGAALGMSLLNVMPAALGRATAPAPAVPAVPEKSLAAA